MAGDTPLLRALRRAVSADRNALLAVANNNPRASDAAWGRIAESDGYKALEANLAESEAALKEVLAAFLAEGREAFVVSGHRQGERGRIVGLTIGGPLARTLSFSDGDLRTYTPDQLRLA